MDGFSKIELKQPVLEKKNSGTGPAASLSRFNISSKIKRLKNKRFILGFVIIFVIFVIGVLLPAYLTYASAKKTYAQMNVTLDALKKQDVVLASEELKKTRENLEHTQRNLKLLSLLRVIPFVNTYYDDAGHMVNAGIYAIDAGEIFLDSIEPYADILGLKGEGSFTGGSAEDRIENAVKTMDKVTPRIDEIAEKLNLAKNELENVNPDDYPQFLAGGRIRNSVSRLRSMSDEGVAFLNDSKPLIKLLPRLLGEPEEKRYLVLFQNDKELRPTGGFLTAYAIFRLNRGVVHVDLSDDIYNLDVTIGNKPPAPDILRQYLQVSRLNIRDSNLSPDFSESMKTFSEMYERSGARKDVDGIIALDTHALVAVMNIVGDIEVGGKVYSTKEDERCKCPQVIYALSEETGRRVQYIRTDRKGIIGDLMYEIMNKAFSSEPSVYWGPLVQTMLTQMEEKHILFYLYDEDAQSGIKALNAGGLVMPFEGDYFHINQANFGGAKSNLYVSESVKQEYTIKPDGIIEKTVTVTYRNPFPPSNCNLELEYALCLNATLKNWFRIYVPKGSTLLSMKGSTSGKDPYDELGKTVFEGFLEVRPLGSKTLVFTYQLPFRADLEKDSNIPLLIQKQPGTSGNEYEISVNGRTREGFPLLKDKKMEVRIK